MWERFTERAKHVVSAAREEATRLGSEYVRTEHILLGLCREPEGIAARALENLGVDIEALAIEIEQQVLCDMSRSIVNKILSEPTKSLKSAAERGDLEILKSLCELFRLEEKI